MASISYDKLWWTEFYNNVSAKDSVQDINLNQLKLKVNDIYRKDEKVFNKIWTFCWHRRCKQSLCLLERYPK